MALAAAAAVVWRMPVIVSRPRLASAARRPAGVAHERLAHLLRIVALENLA